MRIKNRNLLFIVLVSIVFIIYYFSYAWFSELDKERSELNSHNDVYDDYSTRMEVHEEIVKRFFEKRNNWTTSNLGAILFKNVKHQEFIRHSWENKTFLVLLWQYWDLLKNRHVYNYGSPQNSGSQILEECSVKNCKFFGDNKQIDSADAVIIHMQRKKIPIVKRRNRKQRWIFLSDESPKNTFSFGKKSNLSWSDMSNVFNWTMTYRSDSDIPVPYGRTIPLQYPINTNEEEENPMIINQLDPEAILNKLVPYWKEMKFRKMAMVLTSNCVQSRMQFIRRLQNLIEVVVFGRCSDIPENKKKCPGHFKVDCMLPASYLFYLVLENSKCSQYITEKVFQHAYSKGAIPVIMGPPVKDCEQLLPPNSFLHVDNYKNIQALSKHMIEISRSVEKILSLHSWRRHFGITNEHGYFKTKSYHLCRVCEALNYNDVNEKIYNEKDLNSFFNKDVLCDLKYTSIT